MCYLEKGKVDQNKQKWHFGKVGRQLFKHRLKGDEGMVTQISEGRDIQVERTDIAKP